MGPEGRAVLTDRRALHIQQTLKARPGDSLRVGLLNGPLGQAVVERIEGASVTLAIVWDSALPPQPRVDLLLALPRPKVLRRLWLPLASMGVGQIILSNAWKVERNYFDTHVLQPETFRPLLIEGLEQVRDTHLPKVSIHRQFRKLVEDDLDALSPDSLRILADPAETRRMRTALEGAQERRILLAVGPEGGWTDFERDLLREHGFSGVSLGPRTLRTDAACISLLAVLQEGLDENAGRPSS